MNIYKNLLEQSKLLKVNKLNYDFINNKEITDIKK